MPVFDDGLVRGNGSAHRWWKFADVAGYRVLDCQDLHVLVLTLRDGREELIGLAPEVDRDRLAAFMVGRRLEQLPHAIPPPSGATRGSPQAPALG